MQTVILGAAGLEVTPVAYGTWQFGGGGDRVVRDASQALDLTSRQADLAQIDHIMAAAVPAGGPTPEGMA